MSNKIDYSAFLIRWQDAGPQTRWRATVENAHTGQKLNFSSKSELLSFLWQSLYNVDLPDPNGANDPEKV